MSEAIPIPLSVNAITNSSDDLSCRSSSEKERDKAAPEAELGLKEKDREVEGDLTDWENEKKEVERGGARVTPVRTLVEIVKHPPDGFVYL